MDRFIEDGNALPASIAMVLWGSDNLKSEGAPIGQALALMGALPRFDSYGRIAGARLIPLAELGRPRIDVVITLSGIFRDLMPLQIKLLAEAAFLAASAADEPLEMNHIRRHALDYQQEHGCTLEIASLRVYGNAEGAYGSNVNNLVESGKWDGEEELAEIVADHDRIVETATPSSGMDWYIKWFSSIMILTSLAFRAADGEWKMFDLVFGTIGVMGWTVVSIMWRDRALIMLNVVSLMMLIVGILNNV